MELKVEEHIEKMHEKNKDILEYLGKNNRLRPKLVVGFSAETENLIKNSNIKLNQKY